MISQASVNGVVQRAWACRPTIRSVAQVAVKWEKRDSTWMADSHIAFMS